MSQNVVDESNPYGKAVSHDIETGETAVHGRDSKKKKFWSKKTESATLVSASVVDSDDNPYGHAVVVDNETDETTTGQYPSRHKKKRIGLAIAVIALATIMLAVFLSASKSSDGPGNPYAGRITAAAVPLMFASEDGSSCLAASSDGFVGVSACALRLAANESMHLWYFAEDGSVRLWDLENCAQRCLTTSTSGHLGLEPCVDANENLYIPNPG